MASMVVLVCSIVLLRLVNQFSTVHAHARLHKHKKSTLVRFESGGGISPDEFPLISAQILGTEVYWQSRDDVKAVVLILHGCPGRATDFWRNSSTCPHCIGLPEEVRITSTVVNRGNLAMAVNSAGQCWDSEDVPRIEEAVQHVYNVSSLNRAVTPVWVLGCADGGKMVGLISKSVVLGRGYLKCRLAVVSDLPHSTDFTDPVDPDNQQASWPAPPTLFISMPRDSSTTSKIKVTMETFRRAGIQSTQLRCRPLRLTDTFFADRLESISAGTSENLYRAMKDHSLIDENGHLKKNPAERTEWRSVLKEAANLSDRLDARTSPIFQQMEVAWAYRAVCATFAEDMLDFCEDPVGSCRRHRWTC